MKHLQVSAQARVASFSLAAFAAGIVYGFTVAPNTYSSPPFRTLIAVMPTEWWAALWAVVAVLMFVAGVTRQAAPWIAGTVGAIGLASCWLTGLMFQWVVNRTPLSPSGVALWCWFVFSLLLFVKSPRQFEQTGSG